MATKNSEGQQIPEDLKEYLDLDLSSDGAHAKNLEARIAYDAMQVDGDGIPLGPIEGSQPAHLSPGMQQWYKSVVTSKRGLALKSVASSFKERADPGKGDGFQVQIRKGALEEQHLANRKACYRAHSEKYHADYEKITKSETEIEDDLHKYKARKAELGRDAKVLNRPLYFTVLFFVVFGAEAAINFESFAALTWATPFIASGLTVAIGFGLGFAAHFHGTLFKQFAYYFGKAEDDSKRGPALRMAIGGAVLLFACLGFVYYARSTYLLAYLGSVSGFGQTSSNISTLWIIGGSLLGNIIVYLIGVMWAYLMHDYDPIFSDLKKKLDKETKEVEGLKRKLEHLRQRELEQLDAILKLKSEEAERAYARIMSQPKLAWPLELFGKFQAKDGEVLALLENYRGQLIQKLGPAAKKTTFVVCCEGPYIQHKIVSSGGYLRMQLKMKYVEDH